MISTSVPADCSCPFSVTLCNKWCFNKSSPRQGGIKSYFHLFSYSLQIISRHQVDPRRQKSPNGAKKTVQVTK